MEDSLVQFLIQTVLEDNLGSLEDGKLTINSLDELIESLEEREDVTEVGNGVHT